MSAIDDILKHFRAAGWAVGGRATLSDGTAGPNPTRLNLSRGSNVLPLVAYAWNTTHEGQGRTGPNYRVQTTRTHDGPLIVEPNRLTVGFGLDADRGLIFAFDGWTKRYTGYSSSVHLKLATLEEALSAGYAEQAPLYDARAVANYERVGDLLRWAVRQLGERQAVVRAMSYKVLYGGLQATVTSDMWTGRPCKWLRVGDKLVIADDKGVKILDDGVWRIEGLEVAGTKTHTGYPRYTVAFDCSLIGDVENPATVMRTWPGGRP